MKRAVAVMFVITLALAEIGVMARITRGSMLQVLDEDYVRTARSKGLSRWRVLNRHSFRNALIAPVTVLGLNLGLLAGGVFLVETIFAWPGMGKLIIDSINVLDRPVIVAYLMRIVLLFIVINLVVDVLYTVLDPRVRLESKG